MQIEQKKKEVIKYLLSKDILLSSAILEKLDKTENIDKIYAFVSQIKTEKLLLISDEFEALFRRDDLADIDWVKF